MYRIEGRTSHKLDVRPSMRTLDMFVKKIKAVPYEFVSYLDYVALSRRHLAAIQASHACQFLQGTSQPNVKISQIY